MSAATDTAEAGLTEYGLLSKRERRSEAAQRRIGRHPPSPPERPGLVGLPRTIPTHYQIFFFAERPDLTRLRHM